MGRTAEYIAFGGINLAYVTTSGLYFVHADHLGTPQMLTNGTGAVVWDANYRPFGEATVTGSVAFNLRFPGQHYDAETGLHYNMMRDYDPGLGRYVQSDPTGLCGGWNTYACVGGNPVMGEDLTGENVQGVENMIAWAGTYEPPASGDPRGLLGGDVLRLPNTGWGLFNGWSFRSQAAWGWYDPSGDWTYYSSIKFPKDQELCCRDLIDLYETVVHEALHRTLCKKQGYFACNWAAVSEDLSDLHDWVDGEARKRRRAQEPRLRETYCADGGCPDAQ